MNRLALAIALACVLSGVARAGEIHPTGVVAPGEIPSTGAPTSDMITAPGEIHTTGAPEESSTLLTIILTVTSIVR
jgi:hypothetical protein